MCNSTYCDSFADLAHKPAGIATIYQSDRNAHRFVSREVKFDKNSANITDGIIVSIDRNKRLQSILGFGGAFTDAAGINILKLSDKLARNVIREYFGSYGLRYSMARVPIGGSDFSTRPYTYDDADHEDFDLLHWKLAPEDLQYKVSNYLVR